MKNGTQIGNSFFFKKCEKTYTIFISKWTIFLETTLKNNTSNFFCKTEVLEIFVMEETPEIVKN